MCLQLVASQLSFSSLTFDSARRFTASASLNQRFATCTNERHRPFLPLWKERSPFTNPRDWVEIPGILQLQRFRGFLHAIACNTSIRRSSRCREVEILKSIDSHALILVGVHEADAAIGRIPVALVDQLVEHLQGFTEIVMNAVQA